MSVSLNSYGIFLGERERERERPLKSGHVREREREGGSEGG